MSHPDPQSQSLPHLAECCESCAAVEIAGALGACSAEDVRSVLALGVRLKNVLSRLVR